MQEGRVGILYAFFRNEQSARSRQPDLCNFPEEGVKLHEGSLGGIAQVFGGTAQETGSENYAIPKGNCQLAAGVTGSQKCAIPRGNCKLAAGLTSGQNCSIPRGNYQLATGVTGSQNCATHIGRC